MGSVCSSCCSKREPATPDADAASPATPVTSAPQPMSADDYRIPIHWSPFDEQRTATPFETATPFDESMPMQYEEGWTRTVTLSRLKGRPADDREREATTNDDCH